MTVIDLKAAPPEHEPLTTRQVAYVEYVQARAYHAGVSEGIVIVSIPWLALVVQLFVQGRLG